VNKLDELELHTAASETRPCNLHPGVSVAFNFFYDTLLNSFIFSGRYFKLNIKLLTYLHFYMSVKLGPSP